MVIHPRNLNLGERILRFAEWSPRGKQLVGPAAAATAAPRRPPAGSPEQPAGSTGPAAPPGAHPASRAGPPPRRCCPGPGFHAWGNAAALLPRVSPAAAASGEGGGGGAGSRRCPGGSARRCGPVSLPAASTARLPSGRTGSAASLHPFAFCLTKASQPKKPSLLLCH